MSVQAAYLSIILIWSTTPLAIQWSTEGSGFLFAVTTRMLIGVLICLLLMWLLKVAMPFHRKARQTYLVAGLGIFGAMFCVYWGARYIPSGLIALLFGLQPIIASIAAIFWLDERGFTPLKVSGTVLGFLGLAAIFGSGITIGPHAWAAVSIVLVAVVLQSISLVWVKRIGADIPALAVTSGSLMLVVPLFMVSWLLLDGTLPTTLVPRAGWSILYLGVFGSVLGFSLYFYVIKRLEAGQTALITLITPVSALLLGQILNGEKIQAVVWFGAACILSGLMLHQWQVLSTVFQRLIVRRD